MRKWSSESNESRCRLTDWLTELTWPSLDLIASAIKWQLSAFMAVSHHPGPGPGPQPWGILLCPLVRTIKILVYACKNNSIESRPRLRFSADRFSDSSRAWALFMFIGRISLCYFIVLSPTHVECNSPFGRAQFTFIDFKCEFMLCQTLLCSVCG